MTLQHGPFTTAVQETIVAKVQQVPQWSVNLVDENDLTDCTIAAAEWRTRLPGL
jgi:hypothetical protein